MSLADLPAVNACLNGLSAICLTAGYVFIRRGNKIAHRNCMVSAFVSSTVFLACYLTYHIGMRIHYGKGHTEFHEPQWFRPIYLVILFSHLTLAIVIVPLVLITLQRAVKQRFARWKIHACAEEDTGDLYSRASTFSRKTRLARAFAMVSSAVAPTLQHSTMIGPSNPAAFSVRKTAAKSTLPVPN